MAKAKTAAAAPAARSADQDEAFVAAFTEAVIAAAQGKSVAVIREKARAVLAATR